MTLLNLSAAEAAYVREGEYADQNFLAMGSVEKGLEIKTASDGFTRHVLFTFDLSPLSELPFRKVFFSPNYVQIQGISAMHCDLWRIDDNWTADTVTWSTRPTLEERIYENGLVSPLAEMDITDAVKKAIAEGRNRLSFCMMINHHCEGNTRAALNAAKTALVVTDEDRAEKKLTVTEDNPELSSAQLALLPYLPFSWRGKVQMLNEKKQDRFCFVVQTDPHMYNVKETLTGNNAKAITAFSDLDFLVNLGDIIRGYKYEEDNTDNLRACMDELVRRYTDGCHCPVLMTIGNHDHNGVWCKLNESDDLITRAEHFARVQKPLKAYNGATMVTNPHDINGDSIYCYMDFDRANIRVIVVDSTDNGTEFTGFKVSEQQLEWLENTALQTKKQVIIMTHTPFMTEFPNNGNRVINGDLLMDAVERFIANGGDFLAYMYGHTHAQNEMRDPNGRLHISFINGGANAEAVMIDSKTGTIETVGFGAARDREFTIR